MQEGTGIPRGCKGRQGGHGCSMAAAQRRAEEAKLSAELAVTLEIYRRRYCTRQRMQLVVMAAVLVLAEVGKVCSFSCHPINVSIPVESCGISGCVHTTICEGRCYHEDPIYISYEDQPKERICSGDWSYEVKFIEGCPLQRRER
ncbi:hypothetical protein OJAV_G00019770 [Oryzias javanicus]|uniref:Glycoprotein hormone subunit beta domain-containing protein n=1 Tax=Oryzias javanicus TaxID=123683 RepID=A0A437DHD4_ORYJA|nr:hypothetical protein OJAV_G00019770 [Oryzias javanicus]